MVRAPGCCSGSALTTINDALSGFVGVGQAAHQSAVEFRRALVDQGWAVSGSSIRRRSRCCCRRHVLSISRPRHSIVRFSSAQQAARRHGRNIARASCRCLQPAVARLGFHSPRIVRAPLLRSVPRRQDWQQWFQAASVTDFKAVADDVRDARSRSGGCRADGCVDRLDPHRFM